MSLRDQLQAIYDQAGTLTPALVVDTARDPGHPLHDRFDWDNAVAGEAWRKHQAHELITSVKIVYREHEDGRQDKVRAYHAVRNETGFVYEPADVIAKDPLKSKILLQDMEREWRALRRRYQQFSEFFEMVRRDLGPESEAS